MPGTPPDESRAADAARLYDSGKTTREIAGELGISQTAASRLVRGRARRTGPRTGVTDERLWRLRYEEELTYDQIAAAVGLTRTPVRKRLARIARDAYEASPPSADLIAAAEYRASHDSTEGGDHDHPDD